MKRIIVTGSGGQLGQTIKEFAPLAKNASFDFRDSSHLDITDDETINNLFQKESYDYCINCAAYTNVEQAERTPEAAYRVNAEGVNNLARACKKHGVVL